MTSAERLVELIKLTFDPTGAQIADAEQGIQEIIQSPDALTTLFQVFDGSEEEKIKVCSLIYIMNVIRERFGDISGEDIELIKQKIIEILSSEVTEQISSNVLRLGDIICEMMPDPEWPDMLGFIFTIEKPLHLNILLVLTYLLPYMPQHIEEYSEPLKSLIVAGLQDAEETCVTDSIILAGGILKKSKILEEAEVEQIVGKVTEIVHTKIEENNTRFLTTIFTYFTQDNYGLYAFESNLEELLSIVSNQECDIFLRETINFAIFCYLAYSNETKIEPEAISQIIDVQIFYLMEYLAREDWSDTFTLVLFKQFISTLLENITYETFSEIIMPKYKELTENPNVISKCAGIYLMSVSIMNAPSPFYPIFEEVVSIIFQGLQGEVPVIIFISAESLKNCCQAVEDLINPYVSELLEITLGKAEEIPPISLTCFSLVKSLVTVCETNAEELDPIVRVCVDKIEELQETEDQNSVISLYANIIEIMFKSSPDLVAELAEDVYCKCIELIRANPLINLPLLSLLIETITSMSEDPEIVEKISRLLSFIDELLASETPYLIESAIKSIYKLLEFIAVIVPQEDCIRILNETFDKVIPFTNGIDESDAQINNQMHINALFTASKLSLTINSVEQFCEKSEHNLTNEGVDMALFNLYIAALNNECYSSYSVEILNELSSIIICETSNTDEKKALLIGILGIILERLTSENSFFEFDIIKTITSCVGFEKIKEVNEEYLSLIINASFKYFQTRVIMSNESNDSNLKDFEEFNIVDSSIVSTLKEIPMEFLQPKIEEIMPSILENLQSDNQITVLSSLSICLCMVEISPVFVTKETMDGIFSIIQQVVESDDYEKIIYIINTVYSLVNNDVCAEILEYLSQYNSIIEKRLLLDEEMTANTRNLREKLLAQYVKILQLFGENLPVEDHDPEIDPVQLNILKYTNPYTVIVKNLPIQRDFSCLKPIIEYCNIFILIEGFDTTDLVRKLISQFAVPLSSLTRREITPLDCFNFVKLIERYLSRFQDEGAAFISEVLEGNETLIQYFVHVYETVIEYRELLMRNANPEGIDFNSVEIESIDMTEEP